MRQKQQNLQLLYILASNSANKPSFQNLTELSTKTSRSCYFLLFLPHTVRLGGRKNLNPKECSKSEAKIGSKFTWIVLNLNIYKTSEDKMMGEKKRVELVTEQREKDGSTRNIQAINQLHALHHKSCLQF